MTLTGQTVLLTGATGGIGQAIARAAAGAGARLLLTGRDPERLDRLATEVSGRAIACDLADAAAVARLAEEASEADVLIANAALPGSGRIDRLTVADIDAALAVNLRAPIVLAQHLGARMVQRRAGHLLFVSSLAGQAASSGGSLYSATKFGLRGFALGLRQDLRPHGVGVSLVSPGFIREAGMFHDSGARLPPGVGTRTPRQVATAVLSAIEHDRAEVVVAPVALRFGAAIAGLAPEAVARLQRLLGADGVSDAIATGQRGD